MITEKLAWQGSLEKCTRNMRQIFEHLWEFWFNKKWEIFFKKQNFEFEKKRTIAQMKLFKKNILISLSGSSISMSTFPKQTINDISEKQQKIVE